MAIHNPVGTEFQGWLLWYSIPILQDLIPQPFFKHYCNLVAAIATLLHHVPVSELVQVQSLLESFYEEVTILYGKADLPASSIQPC